METGFESQKKKKKWRKGTVHGVWKLDYKNPAGELVIQWGVENNLVVGTKISQGHNQKEVSITVPVLKKKRGGGA